MEVRQCYRSNEMATGCSVDLNEPFDLSNDACKERSLGVLGGNRAAYSGVKKCFWPRRGTLFRRMRFPLALGAN